MKQPKEIWVTISEIGRIWTADERFANHFYENRTHKYISEAYHNEGVEKLKKEVKIARNLVGLSDYDELKYTILKLKKEIEELKRQLRDKPL